jgi:hypothetical protein
MNVRVRRPLLLALALAALPALVAGGLSVYRSATRHSPPPVARATPTPLPRPVASGTVVATWDSTDHMALVVNRLDPVGFETWSRGLDGSWVNLHASHTPQSPQGGRTVVADMPPLKGAVLFGLTDTAGSGPWLWNGGDWHPLAPVPWPGVMGLQSAAYDPVRRDLVVVLASMAQGAAGTTEPPDQTWTFDGTRSGHLGTWRWNGVAWSTLGSMQVDRGTRVEALGWDDHEHSALLLTEAHHTLRLSGTSWIDTGAPHWPAQSEAPLTMPNHALAMICGGLTTGDATPAPDAALQVSTWNGRDWII